MPSITLAATFSVLSGVVFVLDTQAPLGANIPLLYIVPVLVAMWYARSMGLAAPAVCTALTALRIVWFPSGDWSLGLLNRALTVLAIWSTAILLVRFKRTEARLRTQEERARFADIAMLIAHELRNALAGIRAAVDVFGKRLSSSERDQEVRQEMNKRVQSLERFLVDLLALSSPSHPLRLTPAPVLPIVRRAAESVRRDPAFTGLTIDIDGAETIASVDEPLLESALAHLLLNAAQAMDGTGTVRVGIEGSGEECRIVIRDAGPGIGPELRAKIFEPFFTTKSRGRGLGLPIAKRAVEQHGGSLEIESPAGTGVTAIVRLHTKPGPAVD